MKFILSDESVNRYGFRVLTSGINLEGFLKNPVMMLNHDRRILPIGKWKNITVEGGKLMGEPEFDEGDELAMDVKRKCEKGIMNATSIGFDFIELSDDPALMLPGQRRSTVTKSELWEVSITDIPANKNAIKLSRNGLVLSGDIEEDHLNTVLPLIKTQSNKMSKEVAKRLGLSETATEAEINAKIDSLLKGPERSSEPATAKPAESANDDLVESVLTVGEQKGVVNKDNRDSYKEMVKANPSAALKAFNGTKLAAKEDDGTRLTDVVNQLKSNGSQNNAQGGGNNERAGWSLRDWEQKDSVGLKLMIREKPAEYKKLFKLAHGFEPKDEDLRAFA